MKVNKVLTDSRPNNNYVVEIGRGAESLQVP